MTFKLSNAPASFHGFINKILVKKWNIFAFVNLDNILIYGTDLRQDHVDIIHKIPRKLCKYDFYVNLKSFDFY